MPLNPEFPNFRQVRFFAKIPDNIPTVLIRMPSGQVMDPFPDSPRPTGFVPETIDLVFPDDSEKDAALGQLLDAWGNIEAMLRSHFKTLLGVSFAAAAAIANAASGRSLMDLVANQLTLFPLTDDERVSFNQLQNRYKKLNTSRNRTIHGIWALELHINPAGDSFTHSIKVMREYMHEDMETREKLNDLNNQKERSNFLHSIKQLENIATRVTALEVEFSDFLRDLKLERRAKWGWMLDSKPQ